MHVPLYLFVKPVFYLAAVIVFHEVVKRKGDARWAFISVVSVLFVLTVGLSLYDVSRSVDAVVNIGPASLPYTAVRDVLENTGLFALVAVLLLLLTRRLSSARTRARLLGQIAECSADAIIAIDMNRNITFWNLGAEMVFGYFADEITGSDIERLVPEESLGELERALERCRNEGFVKDLSVKMTAKGRKAILVDVTMSHVIDDDDGRPTGISLFVRDITERTQLQEELLQASKMAAMGTMAAGIVHEFGNLLTVISGRAQLGKTAKSIDEARLAFDAVAACAARAKSVTNNLLAYAKRQKPQLTRGSVAEAADAAFTLLEKELERANITVKRHYGDVPETGFDPEQITQVFVNLAINALNAMRDEKGAIDIFISRKGDYIEVEMRDTGPGIPDDILPRLFEPFSSAGGEAGGRPRTGLGLFVCLEIVKFHGGSITVDSGRGRGATFKLYLPITAGAESGLASDTKVLETHRCQVAVIDRDTMIRDLLTEALRRKGIRVRAFQDAASAETAGVATQFDLVFADISVKDREGRRYIERIKSNGGPVVVAMCGEVVDAEELRALETQTIRTLKKPFGLEQINTVCDQVFAASTAASKGGRPKTAA